MSPKTRSAMRKRGGTSEERRVSFASPLSASSPPAETPQIPKQLPPPPKPAKSTSRVKKPKPAEETEDFYSVLNKQEEISETIQDIESKLAKQRSVKSALILEISKNIEFLAGFSSKTKKENFKIMEHSENLKNSGDAVKEILKTTEKLVKDQEKRIQAKSEFSANLAELESKIAGETMDFDRILKIVDKIEECSAQF